MQKPVFYSVLFLLVVAACNKDKFQTRPTLTLKSLSATRVPLNGGLLVDLEFTDKEGDIADTLMVHKIRLNQLVLPTIRDSFEIDLTSTEMPDKRKGEIRCVFNFENHIKAAIDAGRPPDAIPDTIMYKFILIDKAGNKSDTVKTDQIIVERQ